MIHHISKTLAQQIVDTVKDICGQNINFIDPSGIIFASTDAKRIGTFHNIGRQAALEGRLIEVDKDDTAAGIQRGVNLPIYHNHSITAVIGITGAPDEVQKYAHLAERITRLLIREQELAAFSRTQAEKKHYIIYGLINREALHPDYLSEALTSWKIDTQKTYRLLRIRLNHSDATEGTTLLDSVMEHFFENAGITLYTFVYPNEYLGVVEDSAFLSKRTFIREFAEEHADAVSIVLGKKTPIYLLADSYDSASIALKSLDTNGKRYAEFDDLILEIVLSSIAPADREAYLEKTIAPLSDADRELLEAYFQCQMSLKAVYEKLFLHKNTVQYQLNRIHERCGYNPRNFQDAVILYLGLKL